MTLAMLGWTFLWPQPKMAALEPADAIVCLGGGMSPDGTLGAPVLTRIERCVQIYEAGLAPVVIFTGGTGLPGGPNAGNRMADYALSIGLPLPAIVVERQAQSTLQNALFSLPEIPDAREIIVVTEAFHLPRSFVSFHWAARELNRTVSVQLMMSERLRRDPVTGRMRWQMLARESLAIWFNAARALAYSLAPNPPVDWLH